MPRVGWGAGCIAFLAVVALCARPLPSAAIPLFAHQYGVTCKKCHTVIPRLNEFGAAFLASGDRIPGIKPGPAVPVSVKVNAIASSANQGEGPGGAGLPRQIIDEVEAFTSGAIGSRASYFLEQYVVDGGTPGLTRDAWINARVNPWQARIPVYAQAGSFTLPLPVDPETFRETYAGYSLYEQTVGGNPFNFFDPKIGARIGAGDPLKGSSVQFVASQGHDRQSGLPDSGIDIMGFGQHVLGPITLSAYRYQGTRPADGPLDRFERTGFGLVFNDYKRWTSETVLQTGWDSNCSTPGLTGCASSGGFTQLHYSFNQKLFAVGRYEGTNDPVAGFQRDGVLMAGYSWSENSRLTLEDVIQHAPQTTHTTNVQFTLAF